MEKELWQNLKCTDKPIVLYGMGNGAEKILDTLEKFGIKAQGVFASDGFVKNKIFRGFKVESYSEIKNRLEKMIVLVAFGSSRPEVIDNIKRISLEQELYVPDVPVYGGGLFDTNYLKENAEDIKYIYSLLCDDISKKTFENLIYYRLSGKPEYLYSCEKSVDEAYESFLKLDAHETFVDLGAYNGDTVNDFIIRVNGKYRKIYAIEPDEKSYKKLVLNTEKLSDITCIYACVSDTDGTAQFSMRGGRNSSIGEGKEIKSITVDTLLSGKEATLIKYDVEGEEAAAIQGSEKTISTWKPKLQIAAYHRTEDLIAIPKQILNIRSDYKIYLRHNPYLPAWDTNYFFI